MYLCAARKETAREKQLKEEEKILESVAEKTGTLCTWSTVYWFTPCDVSNVYVPTGWPQLKHLTKKMLLLDNRMIFFWLKFRDSYKGEILWQFLKFERKIISFSLEICSYFVPHFDWNNREHPVIIVVKLLWLLLQISQVRIWPRHVAPHTAALAEDARADSIQASHPGDRLFASDTKTISFLIIGSHYNSQL